MLFAADSNDNRIYIDDTHSNREYYCPYCGAPLITRKGDILSHHFAHKSGHLCSDTWELTRSYDISPWHNEWQDEFPKENQEIRLSLGQTKHRADVLTGRTVVEFQHSLMASQVFDDRNNFYHNLGYKIIWLFDISEEVASGSISYQKDNNGFVFNWRNPKRAFNSYDIKTGCIDLFFQITEKEAGIVRVLDVSENGFERFFTTEVLRKSDFLEYVGLCEGNCLPPDTESEKKYQVFSEKYQLSLSKQQERAVQSVEGSVLLLAVPGSGKTTVLINRLGYMVEMKGIDPSSILAVTYNKNACQEMKKRYEATFGKTSGAHIDFLTINSLANQIYCDFCRRTNRNERVLIEGKEKKRLLGRIYRELQNEDYASDNNIIDFATLIAYTKNMMLDSNQISELNGALPKFDQMYEAYQKWLDDNDRMDFDDQMRYAYQILKIKENELNRWRQKYNFICVDEAQDTSKIQHEIIKLLAHERNLFMVGDEDQSIYGFRAAYPKAMLNFRVDYKNPYILMMERNYRSTPQIVTKAQKFISSNKGRYEKHMVSNREDGVAVELIHVRSQEEQYFRILNIVKNTDTETAILFRDNESSVILVDLFWRNDIDFCLKKPEANFFEHRIVKDVKAYLSLATNPFNTDSFYQICNEGILYLKSEYRDRVIALSKKQEINVFDALDEVAGHIDKDHLERAYRFRRIMRAVAKNKTEVAINLICNEGYSAFLEEKHYDSGKINALRSLAKIESDKKSYLEHLVELEKLIINGISGQKEHPIVLSTIHSSKGLEYDTVYMVDVFDGRFPSTRKDIISRSKDNANGEQEERRLFYVGITRAKNKLCFFDIGSQKSAYLDEIFPEVKAAREAVEEQERKARIAEEKRKQTILQETERERLRKRLEQEEKALAEQEREHREQLRKVTEERERIREEQRLKQKAEEEQKKELLFQRMYEEVKDRFTQQHTQIRDSSGCRWVQCEICGSILPDSEFSSYGGKNHINLGRCRKCDKKV